MSYWGDESSLFEFTVEEENNCTSYITMGTYQEEALKIINKKYPIKRKPFKVKELNFGDIIVIKTGKNNETSE